ncbi:hypothetical protein AOXY_G6215 [Acipenser oxyrinchus oxyrinchus]|uniref:Uncharacterized protein n=1 Tax=Acipenser oxyrinchus oxyrinchus TaxID=40147 RepID=A0AAD8GBN8_ACIOX|nr:hypothetical protein AOXY_G6215 [Acipenser oxyrinchus oxyrinchus]
MVIDKCNYKMIPLGEHMPSHYQYLVEGSILAVPTSWLKVTLGKLKEKKATCQLKLLCDAFMQPDDCSFRGGISVLQEKYKDVFVTLQLYASNNLRLCGSEINRCFNQKMATYRCAASNIQRQNQKDAETS